MILMPAKVWGSNFIKAKIIKAGLFFQFYKKALLENYIPLDYWYTEHQ